MVRLAVKQFVARQGMKYQPKDAVRTTVEEVISEIKSVREKQPHIHIVLTGRNAPPELIEAADLVTEMKEIKHPFNAGINAQQGIEF